MFSIVLELEMKSEFLQVTLMPNKFTNMLKRYSELLGSKNLIVKKHWFVTVILLEFLLLIFLQLDCPNKNLFTKTPTLMRFLTTEIGRIDRCV